jgi:hypothetical protein
LVERFHGKEEAIGSIPVVGTIFGESRMTEENSKLVEENSVGTLAPTEPHPSAFPARDYLAKLAREGKIPLYLEAFASTALSGNRLAEVCHETLQRMSNALPVSDRYVLGLAWAIRDMEEAQKSS